MNKDAATMDRTAWEASYKPFKPILPLWMQIIPGGANGIKKLFKTLAFPAALSAVYLIGQGVWKAKDKLLINRNLDAVLAQRPELKEYPVEDVRKALGAIYTINPDIASNPVYAADLIKQTLDAGAKAPPLAAVKELGEIKKIMRGPGSSETMKNLAVRIIGSLPSVLLKG